MNRKQLAVALALLVAFGAAGFMSTRTSIQAEHGAGEHALELRYTEAEGLYWTCPLHPEMRLTAPGQCPICGKKLIEQRHRNATPARPQHAAADPLLVEIDPRMVQNLGVRTAPVGFGKLVQRIEASGHIAIDERRITAVGARTAGWVERLHVSAIGEPVRAGQALAEINAPALLTAQEELIVAHAADDPSSIEAARRSLELLGVGRAQIAAIERTGEPQRRIKILAPMDGYLIELKARQGAQVMLDTPLFKVADLSQVWALANVPESQAMALRVGARVTVRVVAAPGEAFEGVVDYVYPEIQTRTGAVLARAVIDNRARTLKPGMYADILIEGSESAETVLVPSESVIRTGRREIVLIADSPGRFRPVEVLAGRESSGTTAILSGLEEGDHVVVSGQFLIDSEASLNGVYARLGTLPATDAIHDHGEARLRLAEPGGEMAVQASSP